MSFKINSTRVDNETFWANTTFTLTDSTEVTVEVAVFMPSDSASILTALGNREVTEQIKYDTETANNTLKTQVDSGVVGKSYTIVDGVVEEII